LEADAEQFLGRIARPLSNPPRLLTHSFIHPVHHRQTTSNNGHNAHDLRPASCVQCPDKPHTHTHTHTLARSAIQVESVSPRRERDTAGTKAQARLRSSQLLSDPSALGEKSRILICWLGLLSHSGSLAPTQHSTHALSFPSSRVSSIRFAAADQTTAVFCPFCHPSSRHTPYVSANLPTELPAQLLDTPPPTLFAVFSSRLACGP
jgi:hypothetical protein